MELRISTFFAAAKQVGIRANVQNVAQTKYQEKYRWPRNITRLIPKEIKKLVVENQVYGRTEFYSSRPAVKQMKGFLEKLQKGEHVSVPPFSIIIGLGVAPMYGMKLPVEVMFSTDGKAYLFSGLSALHNPQLSLGSWKKESLHEITQANLPYKLNMFKHWLGMMRINSAHKHPKWSIPDKDVPQKARLFGKYATRKFEQQKKDVRNKLKR